MKQEFITVDGKLVVDGDILYIKQKKSRYSYEPYKYIAWLFLGISISSKDNNAYLIGYIFAGICSLILIGFGVHFFYMNQWKNKFRISRIRQIKTEDDPWGLETRLTLYFISNTAKTIIFRTSEKQHQPFVQLIEQSLSQPHLA